MEQKENCGLKGWWRIEVVSPEGVVKDVREVENVIAATGMREVAGLILTDIGGTGFDYLALGTASTAPSTANTTLGAEFYRTAGTGTRVTTTHADDTAQLSGSFTMTTTATLNECGIFNSSSVGVLLARTTYSAISTENNDTVNAVYKVQVGTT